MGTLPVKRGSGTKLRNFGCWKCRLAKETGITKEWSISIVILSSQWRIRWWEVKPGWSRALIGRTPIRKITRDLLSVQRNNFIHYCHCQPKPNYAWSYLIVWKGLRLLWWKEEGHALLERHSRIYKAGYLKPAWKLGLNLPIFFNLIVDGQMRRRVVQTLAGVSVVPPNLRVWRTTVYWIRKVTAIPNLKQIVSSS